MAAAFIKSNRENSVESAQTISPSAGQNSPNFLETNGKWTSTRIRWPSRDLAYAKTALCNRVIARANSWSSRARTSRRQATSGLPASHRGEATKPPLTVFGC